MHTEFYLEGMKGRDHSEDLGVDGRITLEWIIRRNDGSGLDVSGSG
jgi:hypothetical protein